MKKIFKRISAAVIALAVVLTAVVFDVPEKLIAAAAGETAQAEHTNHKVCGDLSCTDNSHEEITDWTAISDASGFSSLTDGGHYYLNNTDGSITLSSEVTITNNITLCLNGQTLKAADNNRIFSVDGGSLTLCDCKGGGKLTGGNPTDSLTHGGAVMVYPGTFTMYGGTITNNKSSRHYGGGVYVAKMSDNNVSKFIMYGGTISDNTAEQNGGGGVYVSSGIFTMHGGTISGNTAKSNGGGVSIDTSAEFIMNDGTISDNTAKSGGGVYAYGKFTMNGGIISDNKTTTNSGGGVHAYDDFTMNGGTISNNIAAGNGGGVCLVSYSSFNFIMNGGTISGNTAGTNGGGVYGSKGMTLNGNVTITGNKSGTGDAQKDDNVYLSTNKTLTIGEDFSTASPIGITTQTAPVSGTPVNITTTDNVSANLVSSFKADIEGQEIVYNTSAGTLQLAVPIPHSHGICGVSGCTDTNHPADHDTEIKWEPLSSLSSTGFTDNGTTLTLAQGNYYLANDITLEGKEITTSGTVNLCLNGYTINADNKSRVITVAAGSTLNLCDCSNDKTGKLTGGLAQNVKTGFAGGGVRVDNANSTFNMYGGMISGNTSNENGGGVINYGTFTMSGGTISGNKTTSSSNSMGGGVYSNRTFTMTGGTISGNTSATNGGGVYFSNTFTMTGGTISGNTAKQGGGVYHSGTTVTFSGNVTITDNKVNAQTNNVYLPSGKTLTIGAAFSTDSQIGISAQTAPTCTAPVDITATDNVSEDLLDSFTADKSGQSVAFENDKLQLTVPHSFSGAWTVTTAPTAAATGTAERTCTAEGCSAKETKTLPKVDLSGSGSVSDGWTVEYTAPTLTEDGKIEYKDEDNNVLATVEIPALNAASGEGGASVWTKAEVGEGANQSKNPTPTAGGTFVYTSADYGTVTVDVPKLTDTDFWTKKTTGNTEPGADTTGSYTYTSDYGEVTVEVPALSNETWTKDETTKPTISEGGEYTYTSDYGTVTVDVPALNAKKEDGSPIWTKSTDTAKNEEPSLTKSGSYTYTSDDYGEVTVTVPNLSDTTVWTKDESKHVDPTEETTGKDVYTSAYGTVEVTIPALGSDNSCGDNATWTYDETTKTLTISGTGDMTDWTAENPAPWTDKAANIEKVVIDDGITSIGDNAFENCTALTDVTIPDSVTAIGDGAFDGCTSLTEVTIPEGVENIGDNAFAGCTDLEKVTFESENPPTMGSDVFDGCNVDKIVVPEGSEDAYKDESGFTGLTDKITADNGNNDGNDNACGTNATWEYDETTKTLTISGTGDMDNWTAEDPAPWSDKAAEIEKVIIDDGITSIGDNAFEDCTALMDVTIPDSATAIGDGAFDGCTSLTEVTIPEGVENIGDNAFAGCTDLEKVTFEGENPPTMGSDAFDGCNVDKIVVPEGSEDAYKGDDGFTDLTDKITDNNDNDGSDNSCGTNATWEYDETTKTLTISGTGDMTDWTAEVPAPWTDKAADIEKVVIGDSITSIGDNAFEGCTALTEVTIPDSVTAIGDGAFDGCTSLTEVTIPEGVENIGDNAFAGCADLEKVTFEGENPPTMGNDVFGGCNVNKIVVPEGSEGAYKDESGFTGLTDKITADTSDNPGSDDGNTGEPENPGDNDDNNNDSGNSSSDNENASKDVQLGENVPKTEFATPTDELISAILDPEEITQIKDSDEISIVLEVSDTVSNEDKQKVESVLEANAELRFAQYMDITLYKVINNIKTRVTTTNKPIRITFEVPANLRKSGRMFEVCRVHNGETALLPDLDDDENTITIETDRFSTYALVYHDKASAPESGNPSTGIAVSLIPLVTAAATLTVAINRKKK